MPSGVASVSRPSLPRAEASPGVHLSGHLALLEHLSLAQACLEDPRNKLATGYIN